MDFGHLGVLSFLSGVRHNSCSCFEGQTKALLFRFMLTYFGWPIDFIAWFEEGNNANDKIGSRDATNVFYAPAETLSFNIGKSFSSSFLGVTKSCGYIATREMPNFLLMRRFSFMIAS